MLELLLSCVLIAAVATGGVEARRHFRAGRAAEEARDRKTARAHYAHGVALARAALARDPDDAAALLWLAANLGAEALTHGKVYALRVIGEIEATLLRLERLHPSYDHAAAARSLGRLYHKAPPVISVGSKDKAARYLGLALQRAPDFPGNQAFTAELYADRGECSRALPLARAVLAARDLDRHGPDAREWREIARGVVEECE